MHCVCVIKADEMYIALYGNVDILYETSKNMQKNTLIVKANIT